MTFGVLIPQREGNFRFGLSADHTQQARLLSDQRADVCKGRDSLQIWGKRRSPLPQNHFRDALFYRYEMAGTIGPVPKRFFPTGRETGHIPVEGFEFRSFACVQPTLNFATAFGSSA
jgi:hypothetical protein